MEPATRKTETPTQLQKWFSEVPPVNTNHGSVRSGSTPQFLPNHKSVPNDSPLASSLRPTLCLALWSVIFILLAADFGPTSALAGSGRVNNDGTIDITLNFRFPPNAGDLVNTRNQVIAASQTLWDASEGQLRFGRVTFTCGSVNEDLADMWVFAQAGRAGVSYAFNGSRLGSRGYHVSQFLPSSTGIVLAHEFGHLALGCGDEYSEQRRFGACWGFGPCIETGALSEQNQCLMQQPGGFTQTEFCTTGMHDLVIGDNLSCATRAVPHACGVNCEFFNHTTGFYETSQQTANVNRSCWAHLKVNFPWLTVPAGLPAAAPPGGFVAPTFIENCDATDTVMLFLDRSGSMFWKPDANVFPGAGETARFEFVKASARAWLALANNRGVRAGIISFNDMATYDKPFQPVNDANLPGLNAAVDGLAAGGQTAIGSALRQSIFPFDAEAGAVNKTAFLISDGVSNRGEDPHNVVPDLRARGIRVFTISTGSASDDRTLSEISGTTGGATLDSPSGATLVNFFAQQWARYRNITTPVPLQPYMTHGEGSNAVFQVASETPAITMIFAGNMADMTGFGLRAVLTGPGGASFDTDLPNPDMRVVRDSFFMLVELRNLPPGDWSYQVFPAPGASVLQTGNLTILDENPDLELFASLDRHVVDDTSVPVNLDVTPMYRTEIHSPDSLTAVVRRPDGVYVPVPIDSDYERGAGGRYSAVINDMPLPGMYQVCVTLRTGPATFNDPGESIYDTEPANTVPVPLVLRTVYEYFFVPHENVNNDDPEHATPLSLDRGCASVRGSIRPDGDVDYYKIQIPATGAKVWINVDTGGPGAPGANSRDSLLTLFKADGTNVIELDDDDGSGNGCDSTLESSFASVIGGRTLEGGTYYIAVQAFNTSDVIDPYGLTVVLTDVGPHPEEEPNNATDIANPILGRRTGAIDYPDDVDYYKVIASAGQVLTIIADGDPERDGIGTDLVVSLIAPDFFTVLFSANSSANGSATNPPAEGFCYTVPASGTYYIGVAHFNQGGTGTYDLMVGAKSPGQLQFSNPTNRVTEDGVAATITVTRTSGDFGRVAVQFAAFGGSATAPTDYLPTAGTLTFNDGETVKTFTVPIINDGIPEGDEYLNLLLFNPAGGATLGATSLATLTIVETDPRPPVRIRREGNGLIASWPIWATGYQLEGTMHPEDPNSWQPVQVQMGVDGYEKTALILLTLPMEFFRLSKP